VVLATAFSLNVFVQESATMIYTPHKPAPLVKAAADDMFKRGVYEGKELRPFTGRPGSMDAYALPSLHMGVQHRRGERK